MPGAEKYNRRLRLEKNSGPAIGRGFDFSHLHHSTPGFRWKPGVFSCLVIFLPMQSERRCEFWIGNAVLDRKRSSG